MNEKWEKKYIGMIAEFHPDGKIMPTCMIWEDGTRYEIDRVLDVRQAPSLKAGGLGIRYKCRISGRERYLWLEENRWFVEARCQ